MSADAKQKMVGKDFIACGILSLLGMVDMLVAAVMNVSGYSAAFYPAAAAFFVSLVYVVVVCKVPKPGAILIYSVVPCVYFFTSGVIEGIMPYLQGRASKIPPLRRQRVGHPAGRKKR